MDVIATEYLQTVSKEMEIRYLHEAQLPDVVLLQDVVYEQIENKETLQPLDEEEIGLILEGKGLLIGGYVDEKLVAFRALIVRDDEPEHLGYDVGLTKEDIPTVIYQEITIVHPSVRGNRIQQRLAHHIMAILQQTNHPYRYVCCTVSPYNIPSLKDKFNQGMKVVALKEKYGGKLRFVFVLDLQQQKSRNETPTEEIMMSVTDIENQKELLKNGFYGEKLVQKNDGYYIVFNRFPKELPNF